MTLILILVVGLSIFGIVALAVFLGITVLKVVFSLLGLVFRILTWPLRTLRYTPAPSHTYPQTAPCPRPTCSHANPDHARFCSRCGRALTRTNDPPQTPSPIHLPFRTPSGSFRR